MEARPGLRRCRVVDQRGCTNGMVVAHPASRPYRHARPGSRSSPECLKGTPPGAVVQEACHIWVLVIVWLCGATLTIMYILSHPSVKVM